MTEFGTMTHEAEKNISVRSTTSKSQRACGVQCPQKIQNPNLKPQNFPMVTHCWVARRPVTLTDCRWLRIHLPESYVNIAFCQRHRNSTAAQLLSGCLFNSGSFTSWQSSPTAHDLCGRPHQKLPPITYPTIKKLLLSVPRMTLALSAYWPIISWNISRMF